MRRTITAALAALTLAACGGSGSDDAAEAEADPEPVTLTVRVTAEQVGWGCTTSTGRSGLDVGNGSRLTVTDGSGDVIGTATFDGTFGAAVCDWTATVEVPDDAGFYRLDAGGELGTFSAEELAPSWRARLNISVTGDVQPVDG